MPGDALSVYGFDEFDGLVGALFVFAAYGGVDEAEELLEKALELEPDNPYILDSVGWYLYRTGDFVGSLEYLRRSWHQLPSGEVAAHLGEVLWMTGRKAEARSTWKEGLAAEPDNEILQKTLKRFGVRLK